MKVWIAVMAALVVAGCSSSGSGSGKSEIKYGTPATEIAKTLGICSKPEAVEGKASARCVFPDGQILGVNSIAGPADQQQEVPAAQANDFCEVAAHGFSIVGTSYTQLTAHVDANKLVARYGGQLAGGTC